MAAFADEVNVNNAHEQDAICTEFSTDSPDKTEYLLHMICNDSDALRSLLPSELFPDRVRACS